MMWLDADATPSKEWDVDPMKIMIENDLNLMYSGLGSHGKLHDPRLRNLTKNAYGRELCEVHTNANGGMHPKYCKDQEARVLVKEAAGFHHITNLDMYRKDVHQRFLAEMVGRYRFGRVWDDQAAVTVPAVMDDPAKIRDERFHGLKLMIRHHGMYDGVKRHKAPGNFRGYWTGPLANWTDAHEMCDNFIRKVRET